MKKPYSAVNVFAIILGIFFVVAGFWGLVSEKIFFVLTTNVLHAVIHLFLGVGAIFLGTRNKARNLCMYIGLLLIVVGILFFIPGGDEFIVKWLNLNKAGAVFNISLGVISILYSLLTPKRPVQSAHLSHK